MVDFNNEATITTAPHDILKIMILERRKYVIDAIEHYYKQNANGVQASIAIIKSSLVALFFELNAALHRDLGADEYKTLKQKLFSLKEIHACNEILETLNEWLDEKRLIKIDTMKKFDTSNVETENLERGM